MIDMEAPDILVFTHVLHYGKVGTTVLVVNRNNKKSYSFTVSSHIVDKSILFKYSNINNEFIDKAIKQEGFYFNNQYVHIETSVLDNPIIYNGMKIFLT